MSIAPDRLTAARYAPPIFARLRMVAVAAVFAAAACSGDAGAGIGTADSADPWPSSWQYQSQAPVSAQNGMVVTTDVLASQVGADILAAGGNAIDAVIAVQFALAVVNPEAGNIGGGGFMVVRQADGTTRALDFREKAPAAATRDMYLDAEGNLTDRSVVGHLAVGVPGTVAGMWAAHQELGTMEWTALLQPAIDLAEGFEVAPRFLGSLGAGMIADLSAFPASAAQFLPAAGAPPAVGDTLHQTELAATLTRIRDQGPDGFYRGETADLIVAEMARGDGIITHADLEAYQAASGGDDEGEHTTHFSIVDGAGNAVAITTTINSWYGSKVTVTGAGFVLNNEMDDFAAKPGTANQFGLVQGENNAIAPGKRMLSAMTPSIVEDPSGALFMVTGTPGGSTIITTVFQTISNVVDYGMNVSQAVLAPRVHHQHLPDQIFVEPGGLSPSVIEALRAMGHTVVERGDVSGDVQAILVGADGRLHAQSDLRRGGAAVGN